MHCFDSTENEDDGFAVGKTEGWALEWEVMREGAVLVALSPEHITKWIKYSGRP